MPLYRWCCYATPHLMKGYRQFLTTLATLLYWFYWLSPMDIWLITLPCSYHLGKYSHSFKNFIFMNKNYIGTNIITTNCADTRLLTNQKLSSVTMVTYLHPRYQQIRYILAFFRFEQFWSYFWTFIGILLENV